MKQEEFTVPDLLDNASFRRMIKGIATSEEVQYWNNWIESDEQNRLKAKEASSKILGFEFQSPEIPDLDKQWQKLYKKTSGKQYVKSKRGNYNHGGNEEMLKWAFRAVAVILLVGFVGFGGYYFYQEENSITHLQQLVQEKTISTDEGEQKTLTFSNGAKVILNSNSLLTYRLGLLQNKTIDVTLEGEAWFEVENSQPTDFPAFSIHTPDGIIRDIGTKFLVTIQQNQSRVVLQEGIVEVEPVNRQSENSPEEQNVYRLGKGEMVVFNKENILEIIEVNPTFYSSWATGYMELNQTGLEEFAQYVQNRFGVQVKLNDSVLADITLDGTVYFRSLDELVRSVGEVSGVSVYRSADKRTVFIGDIK